MSDLALDIDGLTKFYGKSRGIEDVSFSVKKERYLVSSGLMGQEKLR